MTYSFVWGVLRYLSLFVKVDRNKIGNIIADEELHWRITEEYIA